MAYSEIEQQTRDLDIFFRDNEKYIHIASAGGLLPEQLAENDVNNEAFLLRIKQTTGNLQVEINPNLRQILELADNQLESYLEDFIEMAKRGFYSYDKSRLGDFENRLFHLVAWPIQTTNAITARSTVLLKINNSLSKDFKPFDLFDCFQ